MARRVAAQNWIPAFSGMTKYNQKSPHQAPRFREGFVFFDVDEPRNPCASRGPFRPCYVDPGFPACAGTGRSGVSEKGHPDQRVPPSIPRAL